MRALVTGGAGFIGSHLVDALLTRGDEVTFVDSLVGGTRHRNPAAAFVYADIGDWATTARLYGFEVVYHLAASKATVCIEDPERDLRTNALGTLRLARAAAEAGCRFVHASTGSVVAQASFYGVSKAAAEHYVRLVGEQSEMPWTALRYHHVIGPRQSDAETGGVVPIFLRRAREGLPLIVHGTGGQVRSFTSVHDVVRATLMVGDAPRREVIDCASGIRVSIRELAEFVVAEYGGTIEDGPRKPGDVDEFHPDSAALGMEFNTDWRAMVRETAGLAVAA